MTEDSERIFLDEPKIGDKWYVSRGTVRQSIKRVHVTKITKTQIQFDNGAVITRRSGRIVGGFIHTAGPIWIDGAHNEVELLASCYRRSLQLAALHGKSVAIPAISTGVFRFPVEKACQIAVREVEAFIQCDSDLEVIYLVTYMSDEVSDCFAEMGV
jgi:O-acetyl-ADP-ribose deacetylase (regulator of RNase III)